jgi:hypothetical protein
MFTVHVISDLDLKFNEFTPETEQNIPDVDLVILNGNIALQRKRAMLYIEELCNKYPTTQFVYNYGFYELYYEGSIPKFKDEIIAATKSRQLIYKGWPKNLHYLHRENEIIKLRNGYIVDVFCCFGFPKIINYSGNWEDHIWFKNIIMDIARDIDDKRLILPNDTSRVCHGYMPVWATQEWVNEQNQIELEKVKTWELDYDETSGYKILVTHINPVKDTRCSNQTLNFFNIHLDRRLWIGSNSKVTNMMYLGAKFISNPGRGTDARSLVFEANVT